MNLKQLQRKEVHIIAGGMTYKGVLIEATDTAILLKTDSGFVSVQMDRISSVRGADDDVDDSLESGKHISRSFYEFDPSESE